VHILGLSSLAAAHLTAIPEQKAALKKQGREDIMIIIGGVVPPQDAAWCPRRIMTSSTRPSPRRFIHPAP
jgi:methylmalonyl-CoA mutase cobalamin-binding domain/chain